MYAFVYRNGVIEIGRKLPRLTTALPLAKGPRKVLEKAIFVCARHSYKKRVYLVPGIPEAQSDSAAVQAVEAFRTQIEKRLPPDMTSRYVLLQEAA